MSDDTQPENTQAGQPIDPFILSHSDGRPMYMQIMEHIKQRVMVGDWPPGMMLPSIRELAVILRISVITIKRAYLELEREGVIVTQRGKGSFIADKIAVDNSLQVQALRNHLTEAVKVAKLLGLTADELHAQLQDARQQLDGNDK